MSKNAKYNKINWYVSGFPSKLEAEAGLQDVQEWFRKTHDEAEWKVVTTIAQGPYGWRWEFSAEYGGGSD